MRLKVPYSPNKRVTKTIHADTDRPDEFTVHTRENLDPLIAHCQARRESLVAHKDGLVPVAEVPMFIVEQAMAEGWFNDDSAWRKWLNNPDNRCFRVWEGQI